METTKFRKQTKLEDNMAVWQEFILLGRKYGLTSLAVGAPYLNPPKYAVDYMVKAIEEGKNQYWSVFGHPEARESIAEFYQETFAHQIDPKTEILVTCGAYASLNVLMEAIIDEGDEVILIEPFFAPYSHLVTSSKGIVKTVPLVLKDSKFVLDLDILRETLNSKTRMLVMNTPHNPTGKVFSLEELEEISEILEEYPHVYVISDEAYNFLTFDGKKHHLFANIKDNWNKTVTVYSGGKAMWATGWKVGWSIGPAEILREAVIFIDYYLNCFHGPGQIGITKGLKQAANEEYEGCSSFFEFQRQDFKKSHDILIEGLKELDLPIKPILAEGGYFIMADISELKDFIPKKYFEQNEYEDDENTAIEKNDVGIPVPLDLAACRWFAMEKKIVTMPVSYFYYKDSPHISHNYIRFAICRGEEITRKGLDCLKST